jgi:hypothetical protein
VTRAGVRAGPVDGSNQISLTSPAKRQVRCRGLQPGVWPVVLAGVLTLAVGLHPLRAQIDPVRRNLVQAGYQQAFEGHAPLSAYAYYYMNRPGFLQTNLTLRMAIAPVFLDGELGVRGVLSPHTDVGLGVNGGGFADSYNEIRQGTFHQEESFTGHGAGAAASLYHLFNPQARVPFSGVLRGRLQQTFYSRDDETAPSFELPDGQTIPAVRAGFRWGGQEPVLLPDLAFELSGWYEAQFRLQPGAYGYDGDRSVEAVTHLFWGRAGFIYTFPEFNHRMSLTVTGGGTLEPDRLSAYRLGGMLTLASEFPFALPGYYFDELSARNFALFGGTYGVPLDAGRHWELSLGGVAGRVAYTPGVEQPGAWNSGVGGALTFKSPSKAWEVMLAYGYGFDAIRSHGRGAHSLAVLMQLDLDKGGLPRWRDIDRGGFLQRLIKTF